MQNTTAIHLNRFPSPFLFRSFIPIALSHVRLWILSNSNQILSSVEGLRKYALNFPCIHFCIFQKLKSQVSHVHSVELFEGELVDD
jgi:hypothetical protein